MQRPTSVSVIGWLFIALRILMVCSGILVLVTTLYMPHYEPLSSPTPGPPDPLEHMFFLFDYMGPIAVVQIVVAALMIWAGAAFLKLPPWARTVLEVLTWLGLSYCLGFGAFWMWGVGSMSGPGSQRALTTLMMLMGAVSIVMFAVPMIVVIRVLRGPTVRAAMWRT